MTQYIAAVLLLLSVFRNRLKPGFWSNRSDALANSIGAFLLCCMAIHERLWGVLMINAVWCIFSLVGVFERKSHA